MTFFALLTCCQALLFRRDGREANAPILAYEMLYIGGVTRDLPAVQLQRFLNEHVFSLNDAVLEGALWGERSEYFKILIKDMNGLPLPWQFLQMSEDEKAQLEILKQWEIVNSTSDVELKYRLIQNILHLTERMEDCIVAAIILDSHLRGESTKTVFARLWKSALPFTGASQLGGPFVQTLLSIGIPVSEEKLQLFRLADE